MQSAVFIMLAQVQKLTGLNYSAQAAVHDCFNPVNTNALEHVSLQVREEGKMGKAGTAESQAT